MSKIEIGKLHRFRGEEKQNCKRKNIDFFYLSSLLKTTDFALYFTYTEEFEVGDL